MGYWRKGVLATVLCGAVALPGATAAAQDADRSAEFSAAFAKAAWVSNAKGPERLVLQQASHLELVAYRFTKGSYRAEIVPASSASGNTAADILSSAGADLVINGGYFDREADGTLKPTGRLDSRGKQLAPFAACRACSGILFAESGTGRLGIDWVQGYTRAVYLRALNTDSAVQTGPLLVEPGGKPGINKPGGPRAERSAICLTASETIVVAVTSRITLHELAAILQTPAPGGFGCERAINLDGGPSTQIATTVSGKLETFGNISPVQNFIAFFAPK